jgi:hypothetical protein
MERTWKYWLSAAAVLLMVGAGCGETVQQQSSLEGQTQSPQAVVHTDTNAGTDAKTGAQAQGTVNVDTAVDAAIKESDDDASASMEANGDADVLNNDSADLNAYGQAYVDSEAR